MEIPYVIDNRERLLADVLRGILTEHGGRSLDIASAYFNVGGFGLIGKELAGLGNFRLLLGHEPREGSELGLLPVSDAVRGLLAADLNAEPFTEDRLRLVEDLIAFLSRPTVGVRVYGKGFLHAKAYIFSNDPPALWADRFNPVAGIVGSSNFTKPGLSSNRELNLSHVMPKGGNKQSQSYLAIKELAEWFTRHWDEAEDFKQQLIELLDASKFGRKEYTPYQIYMKALYEYFKDDLEGGDLPDFKSTVELAEFQDDAVKKSRRILARWGGVMIADSVGLGKTWIGKKLLEDYGHRLHQKVLVIAPASLAGMWRSELKEATIAAEVLTQESLGIASFDPQPHGDADVVLVDESHNFRSPEAQRYDSLSQIIKLNGGRGKSGERKKVILLTATPISNDLFDLYNQLVFITQGQRDYFASAGIGDLERYISSARRAFRKGVAQGAELFNLLEEVVVRRTRSYIRDAYPEARINGEPVRFPERRLRTVRYDLEATYSGIYKLVTSGIEELRLAPYNVESYRLEAARKHTEEEALALGRGDALVGIFKSRYLKRFESSVAAFRISIHRALEFLKTFEAYVFPSEGSSRLLSSKDFQRALRFINSSEGGEDDATSRSRFDDLQTSEQAQQQLAELQEVPADQYDLERLRSDLQHDIDVLSRIWAEVEHIGPEQDAKLASLKQLLTQDLRGKKVLVFTYYKDTARYLYKQLADESSPDAQPFLQQPGGRRIQRIDSGADQRTRRQLIERFSPRSNRRFELEATDEIDILISTDVLSEGQNLQDCGYLLNYDLHWNPTRMVQRAGRIDRIGSPHEQLFLLNMFPDQGLEDLLKIVESLTRKISQINVVGMHDASVLGEDANPRVFGVLREIEAENDGVARELEEASELPSSELLLKQLADYSNQLSLSEIASLPDGIHSGLRAGNESGVFLFLRSSGSGIPIQNHWRFVRTDLSSVAIEENRFEIHRRISCQHDTPRHVEQRLLDQVFAMQEEVIAGIIKTTGTQRTASLLPPPVDRLQRAIAAALETFAESERFDRAELLKLREFMLGPLMKPQLRQLRSMWQAWESGGDATGFLTSLKGMASAFSQTADSPADHKLRPLTRADFRLICFELIAAN